MPFPTPVSVRLRASRSYRTPTPLGRSRCQAQPSRSSRICIRVFPQARAPSLQKYLHAATPNLSCGPTVASAKRGRAGQNIVHPPYHAFPVVRRLLANNAQGYQRESSDAELAQPTQPSRQYLSDAARDHRGLLAIRPGRYRRARSALRPDWRWRCSRMLPRRRFAEYRVATRYIRPDMACQVDRGGMCLLNSAEVVTNRIAVFSNYRRCVHVTSTRTDQKQIMSLTRRKYRGDIYHTMSK